MDKILILFSTTDGHTVSICNRIAEVLSMTGSVTITSLEDCSELEIKSADKVLVGASIRYAVSYTHLTLPTIYSV